MLLRGTFGLRQMKTLGNLFPIALDVRNFALQTPLKLTPERYNGELCLWQVNTRRIQFGTFRVGAILAVLP
jgi:hypothetical protein